MKYLCILAILLLAPIISRAQTRWQPPFPVDTTTHKISYQGVVLVPHLPAHLLYERAKTWHAKVVEPTTQAPLLEDKTAGLFIARRVAMLNGQRFSYTVAVECHDGQYEYLFTDFFFLYPRTVTPASGGKVFVAFAQDMPLQNLMQHKASLTDKGEVRPNVRHMMKEAHAAFTALVSDLQHDMGY